MSTQLFEDEPEWKCVTLTLPQSSAPLNGHAEGSCQLIVFEGDSTWVFPLPASGKVLIGRRAGRSEAQIPSGPHEPYSRCLWLQTPALSRNHAALTITNGDVTLVDLGSRNGTRVSTEKISAARSLVHGDVISIPGDTSGFSLAFFRSALIPTEAIFCDLAQLRYCVEHALKQRQATQTPVAILAIHLGVGTESFPKTVAKLRSQVQPTDVVALRDSEQLLIFRPNLAVEQAVELATAMLGAFNAVTPQAKAGIAVFPQDGLDAETLLVGALAAAKTATAGTIFYATEATTKLQIGEVDVIVADPIMLETYELIKRLARSDLSVLITGETGAGKELAATALHYFSKRKDHPLVTVDCTSIPEHLAESELFGYEKGAFTGATATKLGLLEKARGGTVFFDEVGELAGSVQAKLLRVIETHTIRRVGGTQDRPVDIRIISATNRSLDQETKKGNFRADLFFRLNSAVIILPPLRARSRELPILARLFLAKSCSDMQRPLMHISAAMMQLLATHTWPGNIRELKNLMQYAAATVTGDTIEVWHMRERFGPLPPYASPIEATEKFRPLNEEICDLLRTHLAQMTEVARNAIAIAAAATHEAVPGIQKFRSIDDEVRELERRRIVEALQASAGNKTRASELIGMAPTTFKTKLRDYAITSQEYLLGEGAAEAA